MATKTVMFIHGMYMSSLCWENWVPYFEARGYTCLAPAWPGRDKPVEDLRCTVPGGKLTELTLREVVDNYDYMLARMDEMPILIGHSMGGLVAQLLVHRNLASAAIALHSAPPQGVFTPQWSFLKTNLPAINPLVSKDEPLWMKFEDFQYAFVNGLPEAEQRAAFDRYVVPESRRVPQEALTDIAKIDFSCQHVPLLLVAGSADHIIPAEINKLNHARYPAYVSVTDYKEFPGRVHFTIGQTGWEEVADYCLNWLTERACLPGGADQGMPTQSDRIVN